MLNKKNILSLLFIFLIFLSCKSEPEKNILMPLEYSDEKIREKLYYASIYAGLVINTCGTAFPHPLGYVLTENYGVPHGMACAAFFAPYVDRCAEQCKCFGGIFLLSNVL